MRITLHFDGAAAPNPGAASWGAVVAGDGIAPVELSGALDGTATNNDAEYRGMEEGLKYLLANPIAGATVLAVYGDSQLVVKQLTREWACKSDRLAAARERCDGLLARIGLPWTAQWIPREQNADADRLSEAAWARATGKPFPEKPAHWKK